MKKIYLSRETTNHIEQELAEENVVVVAPCNGQIVLGYMPMGMVLDLQVVPDTGWECIRQFIAKEHERLCATQAIGLGQCVCHGCKQVFDTRRKRKYCSPECANKQRYAYRREQKEQSLSNPPCICCKKRPIYHTWMSLCRSCYARQWRANREQGPDQHTSTHQ